MSVGSHLVHEETVAGGDRQIDSLLEQEPFQVAAASHNTKDYDVLTFDSVEQHVFTNWKAADACLQIIPSATSAGMRSEQIESSVID